MLYNRFESLQNVILVYRFPVRVVLFRQEPKSVINQIYLQIEKENEYDLVLQKFAIPNFNQIKDMVHAVSGHENLKTWGKNQRNLVRLF